MPDPHLALINGANCRPAPMRDPDPLLRHVLGHVLRQERLRQGLRLADVAESAGVSIQYVSEVERGRKEPSSEVLAAICGALEMPLLDLVAAAAIELETAGTARHELVSHSHDLGGPIGFGRGSGDAQLLAA